MAKFTATGLYANRMKNEKNEKNEKIAKEKGMDMGYCTTAVTNTMLDKFDYKNVPFTHESLVLTDIKVLHRIYCSFDHTALDINIEGLREEEYGEAKKALIELIEGCQRKGKKMVKIEVPAVTKSFELVYMTNDKLVHTHHKTFENLEAATHMLLAYELSEDVKAVKLVEATTEEVCYKWVRRKGRIV
jgi:hypothetical protein